MPTTDEAPSLIVAPIKAHELTVHMLVATADEKLPVQSITDYNMGPARLRRVQYGMPGGVTSEVVLGWNQPITVAYLGRPATDGAAPGSYTLTRDELRSVLAEAYERGFDHHKHGEGFFAGAVADQLIDDEAWL